MSAIIWGFTAGPRRQVFTRLLLAEAAVGLISLVIVELFPKPLIGIFGAANESVYYTEYAVRAFRVFLCMLPLACVNKAAFIFLQAMGKAAASTLLSMARELVFGVGLGTAAAGLLRTGWRIVLDACVRHTGGGCIGSAHCADVQAVVLRICIRRRVKPAHIADAGYA